MRCTDCGTRVKPVISLDIDGTLGDYFGHFLLFAENYLGTGLARPVYAGEGEYWEWFANRGVPRDTYRQIKLAYRQGGMKRTMPMFTGARELTADLRESGVEVWLCTSRPYLRLDNIDPDTRHWLERNDIQYDGLLYGERKYEELVERVDPRRVVAVLDDLPEMIDQAKAIGLNAFQIGKQHNSHVNAMRQPRMLGLATAQSKFKRELKIWREQTAE